MTFDQFFASKDKLAIYCSGLDEMMTICMMYKERGYDKYWKPMETCNEETDDSIYNAEKSCYGNDITYGEISDCEKCGYKIINFNDIEKEN